MRLIDADKLYNEVIQNMAMKALHSQRNDWPTVIEAAEAFKTTLDNAQTIDAEVVVRCMYCKRKEKSSCPMRSSLVQDYMWCYYGDKEDSND